MLTAKANQTMAQSLETRLRGLPKLNTNFYNWDQPPTPVLLEGSPLLKALDIASERNAHAFERDSQQELNRMRKINHLTTLERAALHGTKDFQTRFNHAITLSDPEAITQVAPDLGEILEREGPLPWIWEKGPWPPIEGKFAGGSDFYVAPRAFIPPEPADKGKSCSGPLSGETLAEPAVQNSKQAHLSDGIEEMRLYSLERLAVTPSNPSPAASKRSTRLRKLPKLDTNIEGETGISHPPPIQLQGLGITNALAEANKRVAKAIAEGIEEERHDRVQIMRALVFLEDQVDNLTEDYVRRMGHACTLADPQAIDQVSPDVQEIVEIIEADGQLPGMWAKKFPEVYQPTPGGFNWYVTFPGGTDFYIAPRACILPTPVEVKAKRGQGNVPVSSDSATEATDFEVSVREVEDAQSRGLGPEGQVVLVEKRRRFCEDNGGECIEIRKPATTEELLAGNAETPNFVIGDGETSASVYSDSEADGEVTDEYSSSEIEHDSPHSSVQSSPAGHPPSEEYFADDERPRKRQKLTSSTCQGGPKSWSEAFGSLVDCPPQ